MAIGPADDVEGKPTLDRRGEIAGAVVDGIVLAESGRELAGDHGQAGNFQQRHSICDGRSRRNAVDWRDRGQGWTGCRACMNGRDGRRRKDCRTTRRGRRSGIGSGRLWVSTARGIAVWDGRRTSGRRCRCWEEIRERKCGRCRWRGDGSIWALTVTGALVRINPADFSSTMHANFRGRPFQAVYASPKGEIWATTRDHLVRFDAKNPGSGTDGCAVAAGKRDGSVLRVIFAGWRGVGERELGGVLAMTERTGKR